MKAHDTDDWCMMELDVGAQSALHVLFDLSEENKQTVFHFERMIPCARNFRRLKYKPDICSVLTMAHGNDLVLCPTIFK